MSFSIRRWWRGSDEPSAARSARQRAEDLVDRGLAAERAGDLPAALADFQDAVVADGTCAVAHCNLARVHAVRSHFVLAEAGFRAALRCQPDLAEASLGLARVLAQTDREAEALSTAQESLALRPDDVDVLQYVGGLLRATGQPDLAIANDLRILALEPENVTARHRMGASLRDKGRVAEAEQAFRDALAFEPGHPAAGADLGLLLKEAGRTLDAIPWLFQSVAAAPADARLRSALAESLYGVRLNAASAQDRQTLASLCQDDDVWTPFLTTTIFCLIEDSEGFGLLRERAGGGHDPFVPNSEAIASFLGDSLLHVALARMVVADASIESVLAHVRAYLLRDAESPPAASGRTDVPLPFICALARQCFLTSYVFHATADELRRVAALRASLERALARGDAADASLERALATFALYEPLHALAGSGRIPDQGADAWSEAFRPLVAEQIVDRETERDIAARLASITAVDDRVSVAVRAQYEENPYPRWVSVPKPHAETFEGLSRRLRGAPPAAAPPRPFPVLVAGCGTGRHPIQVARMFPDGEILAVDLSRASLAYAARMTAKLGIAGITYCQGDILGLRALNRRFAVIECGGVLHHLADPMAGWRVLRELLLPFGLMKIALYSERGRLPVRAAREFVRTQGLSASATAEDIRACRRAIVSLPDGHPARGVMRSVDFYTLDEFRDLVLHVQEHRFTLPEIAMCLQALDLRLLLLECPPGSRGRFAEMFPGRDARTDLAAWDSYEAAHPDTFRNMYVFWCGPR